MKTKIYSTNCISARRISVATSMLSGLTGYNHQDLEPKWFTDRGFM